MTPKKAIKLFLIWIIAFAIFTYTVSFSASVYTLEHHLVNKDLPDQVKLIISGVLLLFFCPSLVFVYRSAKIENKRGIQKISAFLLLFLCIASIGCIISVLL